MPDTSEQPCNAFRGKLIHPIVMYPFGHPRGVDDLACLYDKVITKCNSDTSKFARPLTIINNQTKYRLENDSFKKEKASFDKMLGDIQQLSTVQYSWCVDTCQMWLSGLGTAFDDHATVDDVYWLIPGDFNYSTKEGQDTIGRLIDIPNTVFESDCDLCLGEIKTAPSSSKQLIDTYGTYGLLYNWFPIQAKDIRQITSKPRTEFFAISHRYLSHLLVHKRWYAYEQTLIMLLEGQNRKIETIPLGDISDLPQGRDSLSSAMQQVERTERVLKLYWRELNERSPNWVSEFKQLDSQSEQIRAAALVVLGQLLTP